MDLRQTGNTGAAADEDVPKSEAGVFATPENSHFYSKNMYSALDPTRLEIRLLRLHPVRLKPADVPTVFPQWMRPGTDAYSLLLKSPTKLLISDQATADCVNLPCMLTGRIEHTACKQLSRPLPGGWRAVSYNLHLKICYHDDPHCLYKPQLKTDILYFVNCYSGKSQWQLPTQDVDELSSESATSFIACELHSHIPLTTMSGKYSALSYCAGSANATARIMVNGMWFNAFANLEHSLESFREHFHKQPGSGKELLIWTDQVCIDQQNHIEKSHQVAFMRQIYHQAADVYVCLSTSSTSPELLEAAFDGFKALRHPFCVILTATPSDWSITALVPHFARLLRTEDNLTVFKSWFEFLRNVVSATWWTRAWVYQEFIVASRAFFLFGSHCGSWPEIAPSLELLGSNVSNKTGMRIDERASLVAPENTRLMNPSTGKFVSQQPLIQLSKRGNDTVPNIISYLQHVETSLEATEKTRERVLYFVESKRQWTGAHDLRTILEKASHFTSTDPRDLVYAFLGLTDDSDTIKPDYSTENTICHVLTAAALKFLDSEQRLTILDDALIHGRSGECMRLPSWVPDYTSPRTSSPEMIKELMEGLENEFKASGGSMAQATVEESPPSSARPGVYHAQLLKTRALRVDDLKSVASDTYGWSCTFMTSSGLRATTTSRARVGDVLWVLFGGRTVYVLRPHDGHFSLISAASLHERKNTLHEQKSTRKYTLQERKNLVTWVPSSIMYGGLLDAPLEKEEYIYIS